MIKAILIKFTGNYAVGFGGGPRKEYKKGSEEVIGTMEDFRTAMRLGCTVVSEGILDVPTFKKAFKGQVKAETQEPETQEPQAPEVSQEPAKVEVPAETSIQPEPEAESETPETKVEAPAETEEETQK